METSRAPDRERSIPAEEAVLDLLRTHESITERITVLFKSKGITAQQYNVLRALHVHGDQMPIQSISSRLITRVPDVSRLIDRLQSMTLVERQRCSKDRRVVFVQLTDAGQKKVAEVDPLLLATIEGITSALDAAELNTLRTLLNKLRPADSPAEAAPEPASEPEPAASEPAPERGIQPKAPMSSLPIVAAKLPSVTDLEPGTYYWCACGKSAKQPFCDGSHADTSFTPLAFTIEETKKVALCQCKQTQNPPYCDGRHTSL